MKLCDYPLRLGAVVLMPSGERAAVVELKRATLLLRYMESGELVEHARRFVVGLQRCGYLPRELLVTLLPVELDVMPSRGEMLGYAVSGAVGQAVLGEVCG